MEYKIPKHIGFIMDGNGRWAKTRLLPRKVGHKAGVEAMKRVVDACNEMGIEAVSFYAFSTENWARPQDEIDSIFKLINVFVKSDLETYLKKGYRIRFMGDLTQLAKDTQDTIKNIIERAKNNTGLIVNIGLNYGGRQEIVRACNLAMQNGIMNVDEQMLSDCMYSAGMPELDVLVRSSGEKRISNFMLWQCAYAEFVFIDDLWPDMDKKSVENILLEYSKRDRRFGKVEKQ